MTILNDENWHFRIVKLLTKLSEIAFGRTNVSTFKLTFLGCRTAALNCSISAKSDSRVVFTEQNARVFNFTFLLNEEVNCLQSLKFWICKRNECILDLCFNNLSYELRCYLYFSQKEKKKQHNVDSSSNGSFKRFNGWTSC